MAENRIHAGRNPRRTSIKDERTDEYITHVSRKTKATHTELCDTTLKPCRNLSSRPSSMRRLPIFPGHVTFSAKRVWWRDLAWRVGLSWPGTQRSCCFRAKTAEAVRRQALFSRRICSEQQKFNRLGPMGEKSLSALSKWMNNLKVFNVFEWPKKVPSGSSLCR